MLRFGAGNATQCEARTSIQPHIIQSTFPPPLSRSPTSHIHFLSRRKSHTRAQSTCTITTLTCHEPESDRAPVTNMFYSHEGICCTHTHTHQAHMMASTNAFFSPDLAQVWRRNRLVIIASHFLELPTSFADRPLLRLVATLGSKSNLKKVSRKAILDVDVIKTCDTIIEPAAPMALRLSGNLLYAVSSGCGRILLSRSTDPYPGTVSLASTRSNAATS
jgi:hypothetical protein